MQRILRTQNVEVLSHDADSCSIETADYEIRLTWDARDEVISSSIRTCKPISHNLQLDTDVQTDIWLRFNGEDWPDRPTGPLTKSHFLAELALVERVIEKLVSDPVTVRDGLFFNAGYLSGYTDSAAVPEQAPPPRLVGRILRRLSN